MHSPITIRKPPEQPNPNPSTNPNPSNTVPGKNYCWHLTDARTDAELKCTTGCTSVNLNHDIMKLKRKLCFWLTASRAAGASGDSVKHPRTPYKYSGMMPVRIGEMRDGPSPIVMFSNDKPYNANNSTSQRIIAVELPAPVDIDSTATVTATATRPRTNSLHESHASHCCRERELVVPESGHESNEVNGHGNNDIELQHVERNCKSVADKAVSTDPIKRRRNRRHNGTSQKHNDELGKRKLAPSTSNTNTNAGTGTGTGSATNADSNHARTCCTSDMQRFVDSLNQLKRCGWYWGPLTSEQAERVLEGMADGSFLIRDSSHESYILSLSFRASGATYHARVEHQGGKFRFSSMCTMSTNLENGTNNDSLVTASSSIMDLIEMAIENSKQGKYQYFMRSTRSNEQQAVAVMLLRAVSRFEPRHNAFPSMLHLCRFEILKHVRCDHIDLLPLPQALRNYLKEKQFYIENPNITLLQPQSQSQSQSQSHRANASASCNRRTIPPHAASIAASVAHRAAKPEQRLKDSVHEQRTLTDVDINLDFSVGF